MDVDALLGPTHSPATPEVRAILATTLFGSLTRGGTSGPLGNANDAALLSRLRGWADCVLVGAGTVRAEGYGYCPTPIAVATSSLRLDPASALFDGPVLLLCPDASLHDATLAPRRDQLRAAGADIVGTGSGSAAEILRALRARGHARVSCEGGPSLYSALLAGDLVDVLHVTVDPSVSGEDGPAGVGYRGQLRRFALEEARADEVSMLFCRYRRLRGGAAD
ncbi:dihydrofolate reductase family protein [uncultured Corynebacterium sp.]|mgnify:CR=1 FL=1|uniref:dihydrofolate reductase family protein n=1 Tax=uncultured Corynebacterium sp. TaxID=159447 RepID=UPI002594CCFC|nr:dihydrofolate reductase family protein [uncultured Corynebacterium sp.]